jgi:hypothetical protein
MGQEAYQNLKIVYEEITELHRNQQSAADLSYNKLNWILVSDIVFLAALFADKRMNAIIIALICVSRMLPCTSY